MMSAALAVLALAAWASPAPASARAHELAVRFDFRGDIESRPAGGGGCETDVMAHFSSLVSSRGLDGFRDEFDRGVRMAWVCSTIAVTRPCGFGGMRRCDKRACYRSLAAGGDASRDCLFTDDDHLGFKAVEASVHDRFQRELAERQMEMSERTRTAVSDVHSSVSGVSVAVDSVRDRQETLLTMSDTMLAVQGDLGDRQLEMLGKQDALGSKQDDLLAMQGDLSDRQIEMLAVQGDLSDRQIEMLGKQDALGSKQDDLLAMQGDLSDRQLEMLAVQGDLSDRQLEMLAVQGDLSDRQYEMLDKQDALGSKQDALGSKQDRMMARVEAIMDMVDTLFDRVAYVIRSIEGLEALCRDTYDAVSMALADVTILATETMACASAMLRSDRWRRSVPIFACLALYWYVVRPLDLGFAGAATCHVIARVAASRLVGPAPPPRPAPPHPDTDVFYDAIEHRLPALAAVPASDRKPDAVAFPDAAENRAPALAPKVRRCGHPTSRGGACRNLTHLSGCPRCGGCGVHCKCKGA
eukprot:jgi/Tetstr1/463962/TSEL_008767.t1